MHVPVRMVSEGVSKWIEFLKIKMVGFNSVHSKAFSLGSTGDSVRNLEFFSK